MLEKYEKFLKKLKNVLPWFDLCEIVLLKAKHDLLIFIRFDRFLTFVSNWNIFIHRQFRKKISQRNHERNEILIEMVSFMASTYSKTIYCLLKKIKLKNWHIKCKQTEKFLSDLSALTQPRLSAFACSSSPTLFCLSRPALSKISKEFIVSKQKKTYHKTTQKQQIIQKIENGLALLKISRQRETSIFS